MANANPTLDSVTIPRQEWDQFLAKQGARDLEIEELKRKMAAGSAPARNATTRRSFTPEQVKDELGKLHSAMFFAFYAKTLGAQIGGYYIEKETGKTKSNKNELWICAVPWTGPGSEFMRMENGVEKSKYDITVVDLANPIGAGGKITITKKDQELFGLDPKRYPVRSGSIMGLSALHAEFTDATKGAKNFFPEGDLFPPEDAAGGHLGGPPAGMFITSKRYAEFITEEYEIFFFNKKGRAKQLQTLGSGAAALATA